MSDAGELGTRRWRRFARMIIDRDLGLCQIRGPRCTRYATEVDHIVARADGGPLWDEANCRAACKTCNSGRGAERTNSRRDFSYRDTVARYVSRF